MKRFVIALVPHLSVVLLIGLVTIIFSLILFKDTPSGTDAFTYVHEAIWIQDNDQRTVPYQKTYAGARAYVSPITALNLFLLSDASGADVNYPVTSFYQIVLIAVLASSLAALAYGTRSLRVVLLTLASLLGNYGLYRLNIATTISNILAFVVINSIFLNVWAIRKNPNALHIIILITQLIILILLHRYLTAPLMFLTLGTYGLSAVLFSKPRRAKITHYSRQHKWLWFIATCALLATSTLAYFAFGSPIHEAIINVVTFSAVSNSFHFGSYVQFIGQPLFIFGFIGFLLFPILLRQYWPQFGLIWYWTLFLLLLPLVRLIGINFFFDRTTIITIPYLALFSGLILNQIISWLPMIAQRFTLIVFLLTVIGVGVGQNFTIYLSSNFVDSNYLNAYRFIATVTDPTEVILTNRNEMSDTKHDAIISHRNILPAYISSSLADEYITDTNHIKNKVFQSPNNRTSVAVLEAEGIRYIVLVRHAQPNPDELSFIMDKYRKSIHFKKIYENDYVEIFQLRRHINSTSAIPG